MTQSIQHPSPAADFLRTFRAEHARTLRVLRAFPAEHADFAPPPTSSSARRLAWTFVVEGMGTQAFLQGTFGLPSGGFPPLPDSWETIVRMFEEQHHETVALLEDAAGPELAASVQFFTGPGQLGDVAKLDLLRFWPFDQIHHGGQLSVCLRMVGGRVPAIYGPSADEPWT